jgi:hypothetical protein
MLAFSDFECFGESEKMRPLHVVFGVHVGVSEASHTGELFDALEQCDSTLRIERASPNHHIIFHRLSSCLGS